ncbi:MAG: hypothetical protein NVS1B14_05000 [Vulcanimicrobiaceae bacterium]
MDSFGNLLRETLVVACVLSLPALLVATAVGTGVAVIQAATQVQEQTLSLLPKVLAVGACVAVLGPFGMQLCGVLFVDALQAIPAILARP